MNILKLLKTDKLFLSEIYFTNILKNISCYTPKHLLNILFYSCEILGVEGGFKKKTFHNDFKYEIDNIVESVFKLKIINLYIWQLMTGGFLLKLKQN